MQIFEGVKSLLRARAPGFLVLLHWPSPIIFIVDLTFSSFLCHFSALLCDHPVVLCASFSQDTQDDEVDQESSMCEGSWVPCVVTLAQSGDFHGRFDLR